MGSDGVPQNSSNLPPFLTKTYDMVDDSSTDCIVSWSSTGSSFVVWNTMDFSRDLLPQYFKHNNFSSFVRQLNTYGFRKIASDQWEFATEGFMRGKRDALKNIHRRKPIVFLNSTSQAHDAENSQSQQSQIKFTRCTEPAHLELEEEVKMLQQDKKILLDELTRIRQEQQSTETDLVDLGKRLQSLEERQQQIMSFLSRVVDQGFWDQFVKYQSESKFVYTSNKKQRLPGATQESLVGTAESADDSENSAGEMTTDKDLSRPFNYILIADLPCEGALRQFSICPRRPFNRWSSPISLSSGVTFREVHTPAECFETVSTDICQLAGHRSETMDQASNRGEPEDAKVELSMRLCETATQDSEAMGQATLIGESGDDRIALSLHLRERLNSLVPSARDKEAVANGSGSNDGFWEKYLTESPCSTEDSEPDSETDAMENDVGPLERKFL